MSRQCLIYDAHLLYYIFAGAAVTLFFYHCLVIVLWRKFGRRPGEVPSEEGQTEEEQRRTSEGNAGIHFSDTAFFALLVF